MPKQFHHLIVVLIAVLIFTVACSNGDPAVSSLVDSAESTLTRPLPTNTYAAPTVTNTPELLPTVAQPIDPPTPEPTPLPSGTPATASAEPTTIPTETAMPTVPVGQVDAPPELITNTQFERILYRAYNDVFALITYSNEAHSVGEVNCERWLELTTAVVERPRAMVVNENIQAAYNAYADSMDTIESYAAGIDTHCSTYFAADPNADPEIWIASIAPVHTWSASRVGFDLAWRSMTRSVLLVDAVKPQPRFTGRQPTAVPTEVVPTESTVQVVWPTATSAGNNASAAQSNQQVQLPTATSTVRPAAPPTKVPVQPTSTQPNPPTAIPPTATTAWRPSPTPVWQPSPTAIVWPTAVPTATPNAAPSATPQPVQALSGTVELVETRPGAVNGEWEIVLAVEIVGGVAPYTLQVGDYVATGNTIMITYKCAADFVDKVVVTDAVGTRFETDPIFVSRESAC